MPGGVAVIVSSLHQVSGQPQPQPRSSSDARMEPPGDAEPRFAIAGMPNGDAL